MVRRADNLLLRRVIYNPFVTVGYDVSDDRHRTRIDRFATVGLREFHCCIRALYSAHLLKPLRGDRLQQSQISTNGTSTRPCNHVTTGILLRPSPNECEANTRNGSSGCPGSISPHTAPPWVRDCGAERRPAKDVTGERGNTSGKALDKHYDRGTTWRRPNDGESIFGIPKVDSPL